MKRLLLVTRNFPPLWGGMERLNWYMAAELAQKFKVCVIAPRGSSEHAPDNADVLEVPGKPISRFLVAATHRTWSKAAAWRPDWVLAGSGLTAPIAHIAARRCGARSAVYLHGLDVTVPHPVYRLLWRPFLRRMDRVVANSTATQMLSQGIGIKASKTVVVHPGVSIPDTDALARARFRQQYSLGDRPVLLSVGRVTVRKGLREFVGEVLPSVIRHRPESILVVVGDAPTDSLYAKGQSPQSILDTAKQQGIGENILFLGKKFGQELSDAYAGSDLHVFPVQDIPNDPEGFGMVAIEAAAHGLPTIAYATGGVVDAVADGVSGRLIPSKHTDGFAAAILELLNQSLDETSIRGFARQFAWDNFGLELNKVFID